MQKIYSLLRNNKQSGPFSLEELIQSSLMPFDLILIEGRGGGWAYPSEIDSLKPYLENLQNALSSKKEESLTAPDSSVTKNIAQPFTVDTNTAAKAIPSTTTHVYISLPPGKFLNTYNSQALVEQITDEESPQAKLERKAIELRNKIQAYEQNKKAPKDTHDIDTKYSRSLDDIKDEYTNWLDKQQKKKVTINKKTLGIASAIIGFLAIAYFIGNYFFTADAALIKPFAVQDQPLYVPIESDNNLNEETLKANNAKPKAKASDNHLPGNKVITKPGKANDKVSTYIDSLKNANSRKTEIVIEEPEDLIEEPKITSTGERTAKKREENKTNSPQSKRIEQTSERNATSITQQIKLSKSTLNNSNYLTVYNNSNQFINFVAVDVYYYQAGTKLVQKKTLYFNNLAANTNLKLPVPEHKKAESVNYELGLISSDRGLYYAKQ